jgi:2-oxoglutarate/2-oxoacid ferredoxin oxidoreductase subunit beta
MMADKLTTPAEITWCPGCGNFGIFNAFKKAVQKLEKKGIGREKIIITAGIGCHGKIADYLNLSGLYSIHGRSMATAQGIKLGNPDLKVVAFAGDGDAYGEGISHMIFAAKRNEDITVIVHNNGAYALTTGQFSPTSEKGFKGPSAPGGNIEEPLNPLTLMMEAGATFVSRGYAAKIDHLVDVMVKAVEHEGFSLVDVLQPSVVFHDTYQEYNKLVEIIEKPPKSYEQVLKLAREKKQFPIGIFYQVKKPAFHSELLGDWNPARDKMKMKERLRRVEMLLKP